MLFFFVLSRYSYFIAVSDLIRTSLGPRGMDKMVSDVVIFVSFLTFDTLFLSIFHLKNALLSNLMFFPFFFENLNSLICFCRLFQAIRMSSLQMTVLRFWNNLKWLIRVLKWYDLNSLTFPDPHKITLETRSRWFTLRLLDCRLLILLVLKMLKLETAQRL